MRVETRCAFYDVWWGQHIILWLQNRLAIGTHCPVLNWKGTSKWTFHQEFLFWTGTHLYHTYRTFSPEISKAAAAEAAVLDGRLSVANLQPTSKVGLIVAKMITILLTPHPSQRKWYGEVNISTNGGAFIQWYATSFHLSRQWHPYIFFRHLMTVMPLLICAYLLVHEYWVLVWKVQKILTQTDHLFSANKSSILQIFPHSIFQNHWLKSYG